MARLPDSEWLKIRSDYEVGGLSFGELQKIYKVNKSSISRRAKKEGWNQSEVQQVINNKVVAEQQLAVADATLRNKMQRPLLGDALKEIDRRVRLAGLMSDGIEKAQNAINDLLDDSIAESRMMPTVQERATLLIPVTDAHSKVTNRNAKTVFGNEGAAQQGGAKDDAAINNRREILERIKAKHAAGQ